MAEAEMIWVVQVYDTQDNSLQVQGYRSQAGALDCLKNIKVQLDEQGGYTYSKPEGAQYAFDAECEENDRRVSVDAFECWVND
jgi:hypothetical protein